MADANSNGRILNKDIYERITRVETKLDMFIENVKDICDAHSEKFKAVDEDRKIFVSRAAFFGWLSALAITIGIITTILFIVD